MLDSTFELISLAASNSLMVFCFFNLIIAILLVGSSKPSPQSNDQDPKLASSIVNDETIHKSSDSLHEEGSAALVEAGEVSSVSVAMTDNEERSADEEDKDEDEEEEEEDDDDLKRRVEEFIQKINKGWRDEKVQTLYSSGQ